MTELVAREPRVFFPYVPSRYDRSTKRWWPSVDVAPARAHGVLRTLLPPEAHMDGITPELCDAVGEGLLEFDPTTDALVAVGDPTLIAFVSVRLAARVAELGHARFRMLKWDRHTREYVAAEVPL